MLRLYDWQCDLCKKVREDLVTKPAPRRRKMWCATCEWQTWHMRLLPLFSRYTGEQVLNPMVHGGSFDTCGAEQPPPLPELPDGCTGDQAKAIFKSKEYQDVKRQRKEVKERNAMKRKRAQLIKSGANINMRRDKLPGDPKITA